MWSHHDIVTGERLQALADVSVIIPPIFQFHASLRTAGVRTLAMFPGTGSSLTPDSTALARLRGRRTIFVYTHLLPSFAEHVLPRLDHRFVLITHNSDWCVDRGYLPVLDDPRIASWFAQNAVVAHSKLHALPIGVANGQWPHGDLLALIEAARTAPTDRLDLVYCNFEVQTNAAVRAPLLARLRDVEGVWHAPPRPFGDYLRDMARCRWCVSPPGNGVDCHRTWEALYLGVVPLVQRTVASSALHGQLPVLEVDELGSLDPTRLAKQPTCDLKLDRLRMSYWRERIADAVAALG